MKTTLIVLLLLPVTTPDWQQYDDNAMHWRILAFPLAALVLPVL